MSYIAGLSGLSGAGKTTASKNVAEYLTDQGLRVVQFHDRTGSSNGEILDQHLRQHNADLNAQQRLRLITSARRDVVRHSIVPAMADHDVILMDRYYPCSIAYQGYGEGLDLTYVAALALQSVVGAAPDRSFILDMPGSAVADRLRAQAATPHIFDDQDSDFHERVRQGYLQQARQQPEGFTVIDAMQPPAIVAACIGDVILDDLATRSSAA